MFGAAAAAGGVGLYSRFMGRREPLAANLVPDPQQILDLPKGFRYRILDRVGETMSDGFRVPGRPDGMACFLGDGGEWILMRNHELHPLKHSTEGAYEFGMAPKEAFDPRDLGGVSRLVLDPKDATVVSRNLVLAGTQLNCCGGPSPWGWLSCEESVADGHGYVFVCALKHDRVAPAQPIRGFGRFRHEAAAVDPQRMITYLSEDRPDGALYRFLPANPNSPFEGTLQALALSEDVDPRTTEGWQVGDARSVRWVDLEDPDSPDDSLRYQAADRGAAEFRRGEGLWWHDGNLYLSCTTGGPIDRGQIFVLRTGEDEDTLELVAQSDDPANLDHPDNLTVSPTGELFIAEDGEGDQYIRRMGHDGELTALARNARSGGEFAGLCFSPDGSTLFANLQHDGITLAITGPFA